METKMSTHQHPGHESVFADVQGLANLRVVPSSVRVRAVATLRARGSRGMARQPGNRTLEGHRSSCERSARHLACKTTRLPPVQRLQGKSTCASLPTGGTCRLPNAQTASCYARIP